MLGPQSDAAAQRFSLRRVNPFLGLVAVVRIGDGRALSMDGRYWQIQVLANAPRGLWSGDGHQDTMQYFRFGVWSEAQGLGRVPINPILDVGRMVAVGQSVVDHVRAGLPELPFPLAEEMELWLLDQEQLPLALLATAIGETDLDQVTATEWSAGARGERPFVSPALAARGIAESNGSGRRLHTDALEHLVRTAAGRRLNRQWFRRRRNGGGEGLAPGAPEGLGGRQLPRECFPPLPLRTDWSADEDRRLVADYVDWLAPYLLTLPDLSTEMRRSLEGQAAKHPLLVDSLWRLYPCFLDRELLNRTRVEAKLRRTNR